MALSIHLGSSRDSLRKQMMRESTSQDQKKHYASSDFRVLSTISESETPVYLCWSQTEQKYFALKVCPYLLIQKQKLLSLKHPNIISIYDIQAKNFSKSNSSNEEENVQSLIFMELAKHGDFASLIRTKTVPKDEKFTRTYFRQLIEGLEYLHKNQIYHYNLRLEDLLVGKGHMLKITNYGFEFDYRNKNYQAPELDFERNVDPKAVDIFALGVILFVMRFHIFPFVNDIPLLAHDFYRLLSKGYEHFWERLTEVYGNNFNCSENFKILFSKMTHPDPKMRPSIEKIKKCKWYNGPVYSRAELKSLFVKKIEISPIHKTIV